MIIVVIVSVILFLLCKAFNYMSHEYQGYFIKNSIFLSIGQYV